MGNSNGRHYGSMPRRYPSPYIQSSNTAPCTTCSCNDSVQTREEQCAAMVVAMAYVPWQTLDTLYEPENAFPRGTLFPELDKPLMVGGSHRG